MREKWRKAIVFAAAASIVCSQSAISNVFAAGEDDVTMQQTDHTVSIEYLTLQPGERDDSVNLNWYAPEGTQSAIVRMGDTTVEASVRELRTPTKVVEGKYTDTGKMVCQATVSGLAKGTDYVYQISYDNGNTWSEQYSYTTANDGEFRFGFTSDPQIKENGETNNGGWNPSDGNNQTRLGGDASETEGREGKPRCVSGRSGRGSKLGEIQRICSIFRAGGNDVSPICACRGEP